MQTIRSVYSGALHHISRAGRQVVKICIIDEIATSSDCADDSTVGITYHYVIPRDQKTVSIPVQKSAIKMKWQLRSSGEQRALPLAFLWRNHLIEPVLVDDLFPHPPCQL